MTPATETPTKSVSIIEKAVQKFQAFKVVVKTAVDYQSAGDMLKQIKEVKTQVEDFFDEDIKKAHELHKSLTGKKKLFMDPLVAAESSIKNARIVFDQEQERLRKIEQDKLDAKAREDERREKERIQKQIDAASAKGNTAKAEELQQKQEQVVVHAPQAAPRLESTDGIQKRKVWNAEVTDLQAFVKAVAAGAIPLACIEVQQGNLNKHAALIKDTQKVDGVRFFEKVIEAVR